MDELEALLARDYRVNGRKSLPRALAAFRNVRERMESVEPPMAYRATLEYAALRCREGAKPATIRYEIALLGRSLTLAYRSGLISQRPDVARPRVSNARHGFVSTAQFRRLHRALPDPIADAALLAFVSGWRREEVFGLSWDRVEPGSWLLRLESAKNGEGRVYPAGAHEGLRRMIERRWAGRVGVWVFHRRGRRVAYFARSWKTACTESGIGPTLFHDLRRSAVRNYERAGVPRSVAMQLTGHKTESIYRRYAITNEEDLARGVRLVSLQKEEPRRRRAGQVERSEEGPRGAFGGGQEGNGRPVGGPQKEIP